MTDRPSRNHDPLPPRARGKFQASPRADHTFYPKTPSTWNCPIPGDVDEYVVFYSPTADQSMIRPWDIYPLETPEDLQRIQALSALAVRYTLIVMYRGEVRQHAYYKMHAVNPSTPGNKRILVTPEFADRTLASMGDGFSAEDQMISHRRRRYWKDHHDQSVAAATIAQQLQGKGEKIPALQESPPEVGETRRRVIDQTG